MLAQNRIFTILVVLHHAAPVSRHRLYAIDGRNCIALSGTGVSQPGSAAYLLVCNAANEPGYARDSARRSAAEFSAPVSSPNHARSDYRQPDAVQRKSRLSVGLNQCVV